MLLRRCYSIRRFSTNIFHVQDEKDFQTHVVDSKKLFLVDFQAKWSVNI